MTDKLGPGGPFCLFHRRPEFDIYPALRSRESTLKAFLLAGGHGTRLRPLTDSIPKCLVPIQGKPLLNIWLELCARSGITEVLINLHAHSQAIKQHLKRKGLPVSVRVVEEDQLLGSAGTLAKNRDWIGSDRAFWVLYSDVLTNTNLKRMSDFHFGHAGIATLGLYQAPDPSRCGVAITDSAGIIIDFEEKPLAPQSDWVFAGLMVASPIIFDLIPPCIPADIASDVLPRMLGKMLAYPINDYLLDIGTVHNYEQAQITWPGHDAAPLDQSEEPAAGPHPTSLGHYAQSISSEESS